MDKSKLLHDVMKFKIRYQRGLSWISDIKYIAGLAAFLQIFGIFNLDVILIVSAGFLVVLYLIGWFDETHMIWKRESEYLSRTVNPYFKTLEEKIDKLGGKQ